MNETRLLDEKINENFCFVFFYYELFSSTFCRSYATKSGLIWHRRLYFLREITSSEYGVKSPRGGFTVSQYNRFWHRTSHYCYVKMKHSHLNPFNFDAPWIRCFIQGQLLHVLICWVVANGKMRKKRRNENEKCRNKLFLFTINSSSPLYVKLLHVQSTILTSFEFPGRFSKSSLLTSELNASNWQLVQQLSVDRLSANGRECYKIND